MQIYPFSQLRNKGFSLFQSYFYKSWMLPLTSTDKQPAIASWRFRKSRSKVSPWVAHPEIAGTPAQNSPSSAS